MNAEIIAIGTELLLGEITDTNSTHIARTLRDIGVNLFYVTSVGDNLPRIVQAIQLGLSRSDLVITTGGLGPTVDDMTRQAVAEATGRPLEFHQELLDQIAERFRRFGSRMSENNRQQAHIPAGSIPIENPVGTAPCYIVEDEQGTIISLPGVPSEMKFLLSQRVIPYLQEKMGQKGIIKALVLKTAGIGESLIDEKIADLMTYANPTVGLAAHTGQTDIRITARADTETEANEMIAKIEHIVRQRLGDSIYGTGKDPLENAVVALLQKIGGKVALWETGTGGTLRDRVKQVVGGEAVIESSAVYDGLTGLHTALPELDPDAEHADLKGHVENIARHTLKHSQAAAAIAIATSDHGTAIAVASENETRARSYGYGGEATQAPIWAATWGLSMAWKILRDLHPSG